MTINFSTISKYSVAAITFACSVLAVQPAFAEINSEPDTFENIITPKGIKNRSELENAPSPYINVNGKQKTAKIVVDLSKNILYKYNEFGVAENAYKIASGKKSTPTHKGVRVVSHIETFPYKTASPNTKRRQNPRDYGPKIIILNKLNPKTGEQTPIGEFIHGNRNSRTLGMYVSHGCMRMDNEIIKELANEVKHGDIVIIK